jgi:hypothetical protein
MVPEVASHCTRDFVGASRLQCDATTTCLTEQRHDAGRLAGSRATDHADFLTRPQLERYAVQRGLRNNGQFVTGTATWRYHRTGSVGL